MASIYCWYRIGLLFLPRNAAVIALWLMVFWPSAIFLGGQNLKDPHVWLFSAGALWAFSEFWASYAKIRAESPLLNQGLLALGFVLLLFTGLYRPQILLLLAASICIGALMSGIHTRRDKRRLRGLALSSFCALTAIAMYRPIAKAVFNRVYYPGWLHIGTPASQLNLTPSISHPERAGIVVKPLSPRGLSEFRRLRQSQDQWWAQRIADRKIGTQILPAARFESWWDVAFFLPKGAFYALFMPLPGLYRIDGKLGRLLASWENVALLVLFLLGVSFWICERPNHPAPWALAIFFSSLAAAYGLFEFDLGSAMRHRVQYFPCILLFASGTLSLHLARLKRRP